MQTSRRMSALGNVPTNYGIVCGTTLADSDLLLSSSGIVFSEMPFLVCMTFKLRIPSMLHLVLLAMALS